MKLPRSPLLLQLLNLKGAVVTLDAMGTQTMIAAQIKRVSAGEASTAVPPLLDVTFNEDASRIRSGHAPENIGLLRRLSVNLLKREPSKLSLAMKRYKAGMDNDFMLKIFAASGPTETVS